ncbi:MAG: VacJ family lipoprotein, partial [Burkholderiaceae bacterium]|nr:VacJ family lipoprotein [Burkholderiaceae bacterium]
MTSPALATEGRVHVSMPALRRLLGVATIALLALLTGCASVPPGAGQDPRDPLEAFNRQVFE